MDSKNSNKMKDQSTTTTIYYGVYTPNETRYNNASPAVFEDKVEALKVAKKNKKSRFKAFQFYHEAVEFALHGAEYPNNNSSVNNSLDQKPAVESSSPVGEKASPFKGPKPQELIELRKSIENGDYKFVKETIWQNPRYLVSSGDTPAILQEGPRYNALHIAAKSRNAEITELILSTISNPEFIKLLYGDDNQQNAEERAAVLLDLYLNTPNKGLNETPLHFASKHGALEVVEILVSYPQCDKTLKNRFQKTADQIICERAECENVTSVKKGIELLLQDSYYVPVLRAEDNSLPPVIGEPFSTSSPPVISSDPLSPRLEIHAYAGPMDHKEAQQFRKAWKTPPRSLNFSLPGCKSKENNITAISLKYKDTKKGLERIGKRLANTFDVNWKEYWPFLDSFMDITSTEGLKLLDNYLAEKFKVVDNSVIEELKKSMSGLNNLNGTDPLSPISNLCAAFSACRLNDSSKSDEFASSSINYIDKACQVFANRISNDILYILCNEDNILQVLETEIKQLELLVTSYMDDSRFVLINFQKIHYRLGILIGQKLYNNLKENVRGFLCGKLENILDNLTKSIDCFSSDDESHHINDSSENKKPTIHRKQLICLLHHVLNFLNQNYENKQSLDEGGCVKDWDNAEACTCVYNIRKFRKNNISKSNSLKMFGSQDSKNINFAANGFNFSGLSADIEISSEDSDSEDDFYTPPASPSVLETEVNSDDEFMDSELPKQDVFIEGDFPTKTDCDVFNAICYSGIELDHHKYPYVYRWYHSISLYSKKERESWTSYKESDAHAQNTSLNTSFNIDSPKTSTPSKSWIRITGANSPKPALKSRSLFF